jgi:hypothetical protein
VGIVKMEILIACILLVIGGLLPNTILVIHGYKDYFTIIHLLTVVLRGVKRLMAIVFGALRINLFNNFQ